MPTYNVTSPEGKTVEFEYEGELNQEVVDYVFSQPETANRPLREDEFSVKFDADKQKDFDWGALGKGVAAAPGAIGGMLWGTLKESPELISKKGAKTAFESAKWGTADTINLAKDIWGETSELFMDHEGEKKNEYERYLRNYDRNQRRQALVESGEILPDSFETGTMIADLTNLIPGLGVGGVVGKGAAKGAKVAAKVGSKTADLMRPITKGAVKVSSIPRRGIESAAEKVANATGGNIGKGATWGMMATAVSATPAGPALWSWAGMELPARAADFTLGAMSDALKAGGATGHKRFLDRLASDPTLFKSSPALRELAGWASAHGGTELGDRAFNAIVDAGTLAGIQGTLLAASGASEEQIGQAIGTGAFMGGTLGAALKREGAGYDVGVFNKNGSPTERSLASIDKFAENNHSRHQVANFKRLPKQYQAAISFFDEIGNNAPGRSTKFAPGWAFDKLKGDSNADVAFYDKGSGTVIVNRDANPKLAGEEVLNLLSKEYAKDTVNNVVKYNPIFQSEILNQVRDENGNLKEESQQFVDQYNKNQPEEKQLKTDEDIASAIAAETLAEYAVGEKAVGKFNDAPVLRVIRNANNAILHRLGLTDKFGNKKNTPLAREIFKSKTIRDLYRQQVEIKNKTAKSIKENRSGYVAGEKAMLEAGFSLKDINELPKKLRSRSKKISKLYDDSEIIAGLGKDNYGKEIAPEFKAELGMTKQGREFLEVIELWEAGIKEKRRLDIGRGIINQDGQYMVRPVMPFHMIVNAKGDPGVFSANLNKLKTNIELAAQDGLIPNESYFWDKANQIFDEIRERKEYADELEANKIGDEMFAAIFGGKMSNLRDSKWIKFRQRHGIKDGDVFETNPLRTISAVKIGEVLPIFNYRNIYGNDASIYQTPAD